MFVDFLALAGNGFGVWQERDAFLRSCPVPEGVVQSVPQEYKTFCFIKLLCDKENFTCYSKERFLVSSLQAESEKPQKRTH